MKISTNPNSEENNKTINEYGRSLNQQYNFLTNIESWNLPNSWDLFNWTDPINPKINWLTAWHQFVQQPLYQKFKKEEQELLSNTLPDIFIQRLNSAPYIVDYWCGDSSTTIQTLANLLTSKRLIVDQLAEKEYILYDSNPHALTAAQQNFTHFFIAQGITPLPRIHAVLESRNDIVEPHHILDQFSWDKCVFSVWFTVWNLNESNSTHFSNFSNNRKHTLLTSYFISPEEEEITLLEATYGNFKKNKIPYIYHHDAELSQEAAIHQLTYMLRAGWRTDEYINRITFTTQYDKQTWLLLIWFIPNEYISFQIDIGWEKKERCFQKQFSPLYQSKRFPSNVNPLNHKQLHTKRWTHVGYDIYELPYKNPWKKSMILWTTIGASILALLLTFWHIQSNKHHDLKSQKEKAILELVNKSLIINNKERETEQSDSFKIDLFYRHCKSVGNTLNTIYNTTEFTWSWSFTDDLENFMIKELWTIDEIKLWSVDRYTELLQFTLMQLAVQFIKQNPLIRAQIWASPIVTSLTNHSDAIINTAQLTDEEMNDLEQQSLWKKVTVIGKTPVLWTNTRSEYIIGSIDIAWKSYLVSVPTTLLQQYKEKTNDSWWIVWSISIPITGFFVWNEIGTFQIKPHIASWVNRLLQELSSLQ
jgi:hypothetical protein